MMSQLEATGFEPCKPGTKQTRYIWAGLGLTFFGFVKLMNNDGLRCTKFSKILIFWANKNKN